MPNRSLVAWGTQRIALGALVFHGNTFHFICWASKFSAFSSKGPFKISLGSSLGYIQLLHFTGLANATAILEESYQEYPSSAVFLFFKGLVSRLKVNFLTVKSVASLTKYHESHYVGVYLEMYDSLSIVVFTRAI